uniref:Uncharacterized protein n=1 Tax=Hyaloperonospora arabidopsidis (strain Emoy2) TaxID=559515 RepID=M4C341_HYAAE
MRIVHDPAVFDIADDVPGDRGRRVETQTELLAGDLALRASAHAVVLLPELWSSHCHKCFVGSDLRRLSRCGCCRTVYYCLRLPKLMHLCCMKGSKKCQQLDWRLDHQKECKSLKQLAQLELTSDQMMDVVLLGRVFRRKDAEGLKPMELVWYEEDLKDQELILLAALAQKLNLVDGKVRNVEDAVVTTKTCQVRLMEDVLAVIMWCS